MMFSARFEHSNPFIGAIVCIWFFFILRCDGPYQIAPPTYSETLRYKGNYNNICENNGAMIIKKCVYMTKN